MRDLLVPAGPGLTEGLVVPAVELLDSARRLVASVNVFKLAHAA